MGNFSGLPHRILLLGRDRFHYQVQATSFHHCREQRRLLSLQGPTSKSAPVFLKHLLGLPGTVKCALPFPQSMQTRLMSRTLGFRQPVLASNQNFPQQLVCHSPTELHDPMEGQEVVVITRSAAALVARARPARRIVWSCICV
jgi:hypothetical protein